MQNKFPFNDLVLALNEFKLPCAPSRESEIELRLVLFLESRKFPVKEQISFKTGRLDVVVGPYIIEVKKLAGKGIVEQLDRYSGLCEGLIVVCWRASDPLKLIFAMEKTSARIPVELIEVRNTCRIV